ncbi:PH domain-containing protein [Arthrobacter sp. NPDC090010]|uniref:PH domain-containing protein n=1 Tax=Arthrobacter sp. NPDC090010 TaxID=3363942 RepID=UPI0037FFC9E1
MRKTLLPGEQLICTTRPQARALIWPVILCLLCLAAASFAASWLLRGNLSRLWSWVPQQSEPYLALACGLAAVALVLFHTLPRILAWNGTRYVLTSQRLMIQTGVLGKVTRQYFLASVQDMAVRQELLQRPLRSGTITLELRHTGYGVLNDVPEVEKFRGFVQEAIDKLPPGVIYPDDTVDDFQDPALPWELREGGE